MKRDRSGSCSSLTRSRSSNEQQRIAEILGKTDALGAKRRAAIAPIEELTRSIFLDMFGDPASNPMGWSIRLIGDLLASTSSRHNLRQTRDTTCDKPSTPELCQAVTASCDRL